MNALQQAMVVAAGLLGWFGFFVVMSIADDLIKANRRLKAEIAQLRRDARPFDQMAEQAVALARAATTRPSAASNVSRLPHRSQ